MTYIQNQTPKKPKTHKKLRISLLVSLILVLIMIAAYFLVLPGQLDNHYLKTIRPAYNQQQTQMVTVYASFNAPVLTAQNLSQMTDTQDLVAIKSVIQSATTATNTLATKNAFTELPGTEHFSAVSQTSKQYDAMQQYINDSKTFLVNYEDDITYIIQFQQIKNSTQLADFFTAMVSVDHATTASQLLAAANTASADLSKLSRSLRALSVPADFTQTNSDLSGVVSNANNAFLDAIPGVAGENSEQVTNSIHAFDQAAAGLKSFSTTNISGKLGIHSEIYQEMIQLKAEHPLSSTKS